MSALIERLRIHVAAGCSNTAPPQGRSVRELLQQALLQLEQVSSVTLVLTQYTTGPELADALQVVGSHVSLSCSCLRMLAPASAENCQD